MDRLLPRYSPQVIGALFALPVIYLARPTSSLFSYHPTLMALAFPVCSLNAIMIFSKRHSLVSSASRTTKTRYHWILQLLSLIFASCGLAAILYNKELNHKDHFTSRHGLFGLIACILTLVQCSGGFCALNHHLVRSFIKPAAIKNLHALSGGTATFQLTMLALFLACFSDWFVSQVSGLLWYFFVPVPVVLGMVVFLHTRQQFNR